MTKDSLPAELRPFYDSVDNEVIWIHAKWKVYRQVFAGGQEDTRHVFFVFVSVQFFRYIFFEIAFAPLYQLFFAAIVKEQRGRAKTFLEGVVKPLAIFLSAKPEINDSIAKRIGSILLILIVSVSYASLLYPFKYKPLWLQNSFPALFLILVAVQCIISCKSTK